MTDLNTSTTEDRQIENFDRGFKLRNAAGSGQLEVTSSFRPPKSEKVEGKSKPSAFCLTTSAFQGFRLGNIIFLTSNFSSSNFWL
jgi:hypothetical protein